jgi:hypothetical protein
MIPTSTQSLNWREEEPAEPRAGRRHAIGREDRPPASGSNPVAFPVFKTAAPGHGLSSTTITTMMGIDTTVAHGMASPARASFRWRNGWSEPGCTARLGVPHAVGRSSDQGTAGGGVRLRRGD